jgi:hypothetical protein
MSCTHALRVAAVRATGTDPFSTNGPLFVTIVLDFLATESPTPWKIGLSMQIPVKTPHMGESIHLKER